MTTATYPDHDGSRPMSRCGNRGRWTPPNTIATVLGFVFFWPIGLFILFWVLSGRHVRDLPRAMRETWHSVRGGLGSAMGPLERGRSDNVVFDDYQRTQYERIREIRDEIAERARRFRDFRADAKRRNDREEFERFMASRPTSGESTDER